MTKEERLFALQNIINNLTNNHSQFVDARALTQCLIALKEDMQERYFPEAFDVNSVNFNPLAARNIHP